MAGVKLVIAGYEGSGKTTMASKIQGALVMSSDNKTFAAKVPKFRYTEYTGLEDFKNTINAKILAYREKYGEMPKAIVIDSITHYDSVMNKWASKQFTGFKVYSELGNNLFDMNTYFEDTLIANGVSVILCAHTAYNADTARYNIPAAGEFGKKGSWNSVTNDTIFIEVKGDKRIVHTANPKYPSRTSIIDENGNPYIETGVAIENYDINDHISKLMAQADNSEEFVL